MKPLDTIIYLTVIPSAKKTLKQLTAGNFSEEEINALTKTIWVDYGNRVNGLEKPATLGASMMQRLSLLTIIMYEKLLKNFDKETAVSIVKKITWKIYSKQSGILWKFTRLFSDIPIARVRKAVYFFVKIFPLNPPGYEIDILKTEQNVVAFNVHKCPAAEIFGRNNLSDLCKETWCNLDYPLADMWNVKLERSKTIAKGNELCNFKFIE